ncbi:alpha/beta fold hydrolase [Microbacterium sp. NPDC058342]|uniref:alpha/beta fold hydrolase n=1 Tax=Microbacterium sp. NPDC058342 TaxID=3346454 RepID=UPI00366A0132
MPDPDELRDHVVRLPDGRDVHYVTGGRSGPLVVLESGLGNPAATWVSTQRALSASCRTLSYDRAGLGRSTPSAAPRTLANLAGETRMLLDAIGIAGPVVFAGHSWGGQLLRVLVDDTPRIARGIMLIDPTVSAVMTDELLREITELYRRMAERVRRGGRDALVAEHSARWHPPMTAEDIRSATADLLTDENLATSLREIEEMAGLRDRLRRIEAEPSPVPLRYLAGTADAQGDPQRRLLVDECARIAAITPGGRSVEIDDARHSVPQESPRRTAQEIRLFTEMLTA